MCSNEIGFGTTAMPKLKKSLSNSIQKFDTRIYYRIIIKLTNCNLESYEIYFRKYHAMTLHTYKHMYIQPYKQFDFIRAS